MSEPTQPERDTWQQGMGLAIGVPLGVALGLLVFDNIGLGIAIGVALGVAIDAAARGRRHEPEERGPDLPNR
jgi:hypothetical protein